MVKIGVVVGSIRKGAHSKAWAQNLVNLLPSNYEAEFLEFKNLPIYSEEYDGNEPQEYLDFREAVKRQDGIIFVTPEYNRSVPGGLKNALDIGSRPYGESVWDGKPALVVSHSVSGISGFGANHHLRQSLTFLNMPTLQQPEVYLGNSGELIDDNGEITSQDTVQFLQTVADAYVEHVQRYVGR